MGDCWRPLRFLVMAAFEKRVDEQISGQGQVLDFSGVEATEQLPYRPTLLPSYLQSDFGRRE